MLRAWMMAGCMGLMACATESAVTQPSELAPMAAPRPSLDEQWALGCSNLAITSRQELDCATWAATAERGALVMNEHLKRALSKAQTRPELCDAIGTTLQLSLTPKVLLEGQDPEIIQPCALEAATRREEAAAAARERAQERLVNQVQAQQVQQACLNRCEQQLSVCRLTSDGWVVFCVKPYRNCKAACL